MIDDEEIPVGRAEPALLARLSPTPPGPSSSSSSSEESVHTALSEEVERLQESDPPRPVRLGQRAVRGRRRRPLEGRMRALGFVPAQDSEPSPSPEGSPSHE